MGKKISDKLRLKVFNKIKGRCFYCGCHLSLKYGDINYIAIDHMIPKISGGINDISNYLPSCTSCNSSKSGKTIDEYRYYLAMQERFKNEPVYFSKAQVDWLDIKYGIDFKLKFKQFFGE